MVISSFYRWAEPRLRAGLSHRYGDKDLEDDDHNGDTMERLDYTDRHTAGTQSMSTVIIRTQGDFSTLLKPVNRAAQVIIAHSTLPYTFWRRYYYWCFTDEVLRG